MEDKTFELLTKMYSEFTRFKNDMLEFRNESNSRLNKIEITLENDIKTNIQALHERESTNSKKLDEHGRQLTDINNKLDYLALSVNSQDKRLEVMEMSKKKNAK